MPGTHFQFYNHLLGSTNQLFQNLRPLLYVLMPPTRAWALWVERMKPTTTNNMPISGATHGGDAGVPLIDNSTAESRPF